MNNTDPRSIIEWLIRVGKERVTVWRISVLTRGEDPFINMLYKAFLASNLGDAFASWKVEEVKYGAQMAKKTVFDYLNEKYEKGKIHKWLEELGAHHPNIEGAVRGLLRVERELNLRSGKADLNTMEKLYKELKNVKGIGEKLRHYIVYDLIRVYGFPAPRNLGYFDELAEKLKTLGIKDLNIVNGEEWPWIDAAIWDLKLSASEVMK